MDIKTKLLSNVKIESSTDEPDDHSFFGLTSGASCRTGKTFRFITLSGY